MVSFGARYRWDIKWNIQNQKGFDTLFTPMVEAGPAQGREGKKKLAEFNQLLKKMDCDISLIQAAPSALSKDPDTRGGFDKIAIDSLELHFKNFIDKIKTNMGSQDARETVAQREIEEVRFFNEAYCYCGKSLYLTE
jgi:hypothetical protein